MATAAAVASGLSDNLIRRAADVTFYLGQQTIDDVAEFVAQRTLLALGVRSELPEGLRYEGMI